MPSSRSLARAPGSTSWPCPLKLLSAPGSWENKLVAMSQGVYPHLLCRYLCDCFAQGSQSRATVILTPCSRFNGLTFATVRNAGNDNLPLLTPVLRQLTCACIAGHMVGGTQPERALAMFQRFLNGEEL